MLIISLLDNFLPLIYLLVNKIFFSFSWFWIYMNGIILYAFFWELLLLLNTIFRSSHHDVCSFGLLILTAAHFIKNLPRFSSSFYAWWTFRFSPLQMTHLQIFMNILPHAHVRSPGPTLPRNPELISKLTYDQTLNIFSNLIM